MKKKVMLIVIGVGVLIAIALFVATKIFSAQMGKALESELNGFLQSYQDLHIEFEPFVCEGSTKIVCKSPHLTIMKHSIVQDSQHPHTQTESLVQLVHFNNPTLSFGGSKTKALIDIESDIIISDRQFHTQCANVLSFTDPLLDLNTQCNTQLGDMNLSHIIRLALAHPSFQSSNLHKIIKSFKDSQQRDWLLENLEFTLKHYHSQLKSPSLKNSISTFAGLTQEDMQFLGVTLAIMESSLRQAQNNQTKELESALADAVKIASDMFIDDSIQEVWQELTPKENIQKFFALKDVAHISLADIAANFNLRSGKQ